MERSWIGTSNLFLAATKTSYTKAVIISTHTDMQLNGPAGVSSLYNYYHHLHEALLSAYDEWRVQLALKTSSTGRLQSIFDEVASKVADWDVRIQTIYRRGSGRYIMLMPHGRAAFSKGKQLMRIHALSQLSQAIGSDPQLAGVKAEVDYYYALLSSTDSNQKGACSLANSKSYEVEQARVAACKGLHYVQSGLVQHFIDDPSQANRFFRLDLIRNIRQKTFQGRVAAGSLKGIMKRTFKPTDLIDIENPGYVDLEFYLSPSKHGLLLPDTAPLIVQPGTNVQVPVTALGSLSNTFLTVRNPSDLVEGVWMVGV